MEAFDLTVLGSGPGGYVAAIRAAQLGLNVAIIERDALGGVCLNWGCIPTKSLLRIAENYQVIQEAASWGFEVGQVSVNWDQVIARSRQAAEKLSGGVGFLMKKNKISVIKGHGRLVTPNRLVVQDETNGEQHISTKSTIIATGARPATLPGVELNGKQVISSKEAMILKQLPSTLTIIGGGAIGLEFAYFYATFGTKVTIVEYMDRILPTGDTDISAALTRSFKKQGIVIHTSSRVSSVETTSNGTKTTFEKNGK
ncbi:MAG: FAD-dependent oxidoreductase, partial [Planctomycetes bacterium]|nr:FAD-dependent oxidoreductase [Planctomycetota bacterium]